MIADQVTKIEYKVTILGVGFKLQLVESGDPYSVEDIVQQPIRVLVTHLSSGVIVISVIQSSRLIRGCPTPYCYGASARAYSVVRCSVRLDISAQR